MARAVVTALAKAVEGLAAGAARSGRVAEAISALQAVEQAEEEAKGVVEELKNGTHPFTAGERALLEGALRRGAAAKGRRRMQDYERLDEFLSEMDWQNLVRGTQTADRCELLCERAWGLGCRAPSEATLGHWSALVSMLHGDTSAWGMRCVLQKLKGIWKGTAKRGGRRDGDDLPFLTALPDSVDQFPAAYGTVAAGLPEHRRPFQHREICETAARVALEDPAEHSAAAADASHGPRAVRAADVGSNARGWGRVAGGTGAGGGAAGAARLPAQARPAGTPTGHRERRRRRAQ